MSDYEEVRCPRCGQNAEENLFFADDDVDMEHPFCECGYEWPVAVDIVPIEEDRTCLDCGGSGLEMDGPEWCEHCDGEGYEWWR